MLFTLYRRATSDTDAPGANDAATISRLSASGQDQLCRFTLRLVSITELVDTSHRPRPTTRYSRRLKHEFLGGLPRRDTHTIARVAEMLGENEEWLWDVATEMDQEDGLIWIYGPGDDSVMGFTDFGIETLTGIVEIHKADPSLLKRATDPD